MSPRTRHTRDCRDFASMSTGTMASAGRERSSAIERVSLQTFELSGVGSKCKGQPSRVSEARSEKPTTALRTRFTHLHAPQECEL